MRPVRILPYDPAWPERAQAAAARIAEALGANALAVHHIGSTAVRGLAAKPVLDLLPVVRDLDAVDEALVRAGYVARGEYGLAGRRYFVRDAEGVRAEHVHVYPEGHAAVARHLAVRDYLRAHTAVAMQYATLKQTLAAVHPNDRPRYQAGKAPFLADVERRALDWAAQRSADPS